MPPPTRPPHLVRWRRALLFASLLGSAARAADAGATPATLGGLSLEEPMEVRIEKVPTTRTLAQNRAPRFTLTNLTLTSAHVIKGWVFSATAYNLFDVDHLAPGASDHVQDTLPQPGRALRFKATFRF